MGQVIDQINILTNNLDELRAEINTLRTTYLGNGHDALCENDFKCNRGGEINVLRKFKKYMKKVLSLYSLGKEQKLGKSQKHYPSTNMHPPLSSFLNYVFRARRKGDTRETPTKINYVKNQSNQTNEKLDGLAYQWITKYPSTFIDVENVNDTGHHGFSSKRHGNEEYNKIIFPRKNENLTPRFSEISCELDLQVENPTYFPSVSDMNIFPDSYISKNRPHGREVSLPNKVNNRQSATKSTQTKVTKMRRKARNFHPRQSNFCFPRIKNAVITKKIIRNSNESTFTVCGEVCNMKDYSHFKKNRCKQCLCKKKRNKFTQWIGEKTNERNVHLNQTVQERENNSSVNNDNVFQTSLSVKEPDLSSSSGSLDLEVNISSCSSNIDEFSERRKPRTYVIRQKAQKCNEDKWLNNFERSVVYVGQISDLTLSSHSFSNQSDHFD
ncbi:hypothetical protein WN48_08876 [Eufriesea mexicana]|uniref:Uncharacterized protein n=2 Tax=Eufriesea mexicana TaxID=516756 RepID=A0A310SEM3_9HYME|nr:hypothetical protein WN48_08876 [Eufriesea mexicana]